MRRSVRGVLTVGTTAAVLLAGGTTVASADTTPTPTPSYRQVTLSPEESQKLCAERLPKMIERRDKLATRINGGADVKGSVAWLKARAAKQKEKGHDKVAANLEKRAEKRADRLKQLGTVKTKLEAFKTAHCQVAK